MSDDMRVNSAGLAEALSEGAPETEHLFELSILRTTGNVRIALLMLLLVVALSSPMYVANRLTVYISLVIGVLLTLWTRFEARWSAMHAEGQMKTATMVVMLGDLAWLTLFVHGTGGINSPFSALLLIPIIFASGFFSLLRLAVALTTGLVIMVYVFLAVTAPTDGGTAWRLAGMLFAIIAIAWVSYGLCLVLERERRTNELVVHHLSEGVILIDGGGWIRLVNAPLQRYTRASTERILGLNVDEMEGRPEFETLADILRDVRAPGSGAQKRDRDVSVEGPERTDLRVSTIPVGGGIGRPAGWLVLCQDVTEMKTVARMRESGIRILSHEIRSPLTTFKMISSVFAQLADRLSDERSSKLIELVDHETDRMLRLVGQFLDVAAIEDPSYQLNMRPFEVRELVNKAADTLEVRATENDISVSRDCEDGLPLINGDQDRVEDVLHNLCDNALKHTDAGGSISIKADQDGGYVRLAVSDTGCGIPEDRQEIIFQEFAQVNSARSGSALEKGIGLGLYMGRRIVELHGGRLEVESEVGVGSTFTIYLPIDAQSSEDAEPDPA